MLEELTVTFTEVVRAPGAVFDAVERERKAADCEASLDHVGGDGCPRLLASRGHGPMPGWHQFARLGVCLRCCGVGGVLRPHQSLHLLVERAV